MSKAKTKHPPFKKQETTRFPFEYCMPDRATLTATRIAIKLSNEQKGWFLLLKLRRLTGMQAYVIDATYEAERVKRVIRCKIHWADYLDGFIACYELFKNGGLK